MRFFERLSAQALADAIEQGKFEVKPQSYNQYREAQARAFMKMVEE